MYVKGLKLSLKHLQNKRKLLTDRIAKNSAKLENVEGRIKSLEKSSALNKSGPLFHEKMTARFLHKALGQDLLRQTAFTTEIKLLTSEIKLLTSQMNLFNQTVSLSTTITYYKTADGISRAATLFKRGAAAAAFITVATIGSVLSANIEKKQKKEDALDAAGALENLLDDSGSLEKLLDDYAADSKPKSQDPFPWDQFADTLITTTTEFILAHRAYAKAKKDLYAHLEIALYRDQ